jgi:hypothetical protein
MQWVIAAPLDLDHSARLVGGAGGAMVGVARGADAYGKYDTIWDGKQQITQHQDT